MLIRSFLFLFSIIDNFWWFYEKSSQEYLVNAEVTATSTKKIYFCFYLEYSSVYIIKNNVKTRIRIL